MIRALLVDDEPLVRERVRTLLELHPDVQILGECGDGLSALEAIQTLKPDLVFLDIQMPGLSGLDVLEALQGDGPMPLVIFITAYDQYALEAFKQHALDYLLKPFDPERFQKSLERARALLAGQERSDLDRRVQAMLEAHERKRSLQPHIVVREEDRYRLIRTRDIICLEATGNYVCLYCEKSMYTLRGTLTSMEAKLDPDRFLRTHRSWIVNLDYIREAQPWTKGNWMLLTHGGHKVPLSPQHREALTKILG